MKQLDKEENATIQIEKNIMFVSTIYDSFEALEEILSKLKLKEATNLVRLAKKSFAEEVFKYAKENNIYVSNTKENTENRIAIN